MKIHRSQSFQRFKPKLLEDGSRSQLVDAPLTVLRRIQKGTMNYSWKGVMCNKNPFDLALYAHLLWQLKPRTIIEIGYKFGGSALWFADQAEVMGLETSLLCLDVEQRELITDPRIEFIYGDGRNLGAVLTNEKLAQLPRPWLIVEDADHHYITCLAVMSFFAPHLIEGDYLCIEDGLCDTTGNAAKYDGGPNRAIFEYLADSPDIYAVDAEYCDFFGNNMTWCTNGWLRRTSVPA